MIDKVCRLCLGTENLLDVFDGKVADDMADIIHVTSGVQILKTDPITQMVCSTCCQITIKMFKFRNTSIKNNKDLKAKQADYNLSVLANAFNKQPLDTTKNEINLEADTIDHNSQLTSSTKKPLETTLVNPKIEGITITKKPQSTPVVQKSPADPIVKKSLSSPIVKKSLSSPTAKKLLSPKITQKYRSAHASVKEILRKYPKIILSDVPLTSHFGAYITLMTDEVEDWFKEKNVSEEEFENLKKIAYEQGFGKPSVSGKRSRSSSVNKVESKKPESITPPTVDNRNKRRKIVFNDVVSNEPVKIQLQVNEKNQLINVERLNISKNSSISVIAKIDTKNSLSKGTKINSEKSIPDSCKRDTLNKENTTKLNDVITLKSLLETSLGVGNSYSKIDGRTVDLCDDTDGIATFQIGSNKNIGSEITIRQLKEHNNSGTVTKILAENIKTETEIRDNTLKSVPKNQSEPFNIRPVLEKNKTSDILQSLLHFEESQNAKEQSASKSTSSWNSDPIMLDDDSCVSFSSNGSFGNHIEGDSNGETDITDFAKSLELEPKNQNQLQNMPDLSLVSVASKTKLFTCKICYTHYHRKKELELHQKRTHTKCPFCYKRFRNLTKRDEHVKNDCTMNTQNMKTIDIQLVRIDEDVTVLNKYVTAFERPDDNGRLDTAPLNTAQLETEPVHITPVPTANVHNTPVPTPKIASAPVPTAPLENDSSVNGFKSLQNETVGQSKELNKIDLVNQPVSSKDNKVLAKSESALHSKSLQRSVKKSTSALHSKPLQRSVKRQATITKTDSKVPKKTNNRNSGGLKGTSALLAMKEIEEFIRSSEIITESDEEFKAKHPKKKKKPTKKKPVLSIKEAVICISDEENDRTPPITTEETNPKKIVKNNPNFNGRNINFIDLLKDVGKNEADAILLVKEKLMETKEINLRENATDWEKNSAIESGSIPTTKTFKNLRKYLHHYNIPVNINYGSDISAEYRPVKPPAETKISDLWKGMVPKELKRPTITKPVQPQAKSLISSVFQLTTISLSQEGSLETENVVSTPNSSTSFNNILLPADNQTNLPSAQGPLPIIQSVTSLDETDFNCTKITVNDVTSSGGKVVVSTDSTVPNENVNKYVVEAAASVVTQSAIRVKQLSDLF